MAKMPNKKKTKGKDPAGLAKPPPIASPLMSLSRADERHNHRSDGLALCTVDRVTPCRSWV